MIKRTNDSADLLIAISPSLQKMVKQSGLKKDIWCRPNPVDLSRFHSPTRTQREEARFFLKTWIPMLSDDSVLILQVGRIRPIKNQLFMCEVLFHLPDKYQLLMVGPLFEQNKDYLQEIKNFIQREGLGHKVHIRPIFFEEIERLMWGADLYAFPSTSEGLGNVMLEALSTGLPVAAAELNGVTDWIIDPNSNGSLCEATAEAFANGIIHAASFRNRRDQISKRAKERFGNLIIDRQYWEYIRNLIKKPFDEKNAEILRCQRRNKQL
jgi:glycosyltransferase involved in cell wall biosynthesis